MWSFWFKAHTIVALKFIVLIIEHKILESSDCIILFFIILIMSRSYIELCLIHLNKIVTDYKHDTK